MERLEDRIVMSTFVVTLATDTGPINSTVTPLGGGTTGDLRSAIYQADQSPGTANTIDLTGISGTIHLSAMLPPIFTTGSGSLTITGPGASNLTISGGGASRDLFIVQGTVNISGLTIANGLAKGGNGGLGSFVGGGGGGAGMGGGLLIDGTTATTNVTLTNLVFTGNQAVGGAGGGNTATGQGFSYGGGGGAGGNGGNGNQEVAGGGGFLGNGGNGNANIGAGGGGGFTGTGGTAGGNGASIGGGGASDTGSGSTGGGNGTLQNAGGGGSQGFAGSSAGSAGAGTGTGDGGFGGGGGGNDSGSSTGAGGSYGGAGGYSTGKGGFGGGAGGGNPGQGGGFGGGGGGSNGSGANNTGGTQGGNGDGAGDGGGGAGLGGAIFDRAGTVSLNNIAFNSNSATGGASGGGTATAGKGKGGALYILGTVSGSVTFGASGNANTAGNALAVTANPQDNSNVFGSFLLPASMTSVAPTPNPSTFGQSVTLTASVVTASGTPTGTITFMDGSTMLGTSTITSGAATFTTSNWAVGAHSITAVYGGDSNFAGSTSLVSTLTVDQALSTNSVIASPNPAIFGQAVILTDTVTSSGGTPTGTVTFEDGSTTLGAGTLAGGVATFNTSALTIGSHMIVADYGGDADFAASNSGDQLAIVPQETTTAGAVIQAITATVAPTARKAKFTIALSDAIGVTLFGTKSVLVKNGHIAFKGLSIQKAGTYTLAISDASQGTVLEQSLVISPGNASAVGFSHAQFSLSLNTPFAAAVNVADRFGNTVSTTPLDVTLTLRSYAVKKTLEGTTTVSPVAGIATFPSVSIPQPGTYRLWARYGDTLILGSSDIFTVI